MQIDKLREEIDKLDEYIIKILDKRFELTDQIGKVKKDEDVEVEDNKREEEIIKKISQLTSQDKTNSVVSIYGTILSESKLRQNFE